MWPDAWHHSGGLLPHCSHPVKGMNSISKHQNSKNKRGNQFEIGNLAEIQKNSKLFVTTEKNHPANNEEEKTGNFQEEFVECSKDTPESLLQQSQHSVESYSCPFILKG
jgi:hypothetical protein